MSVFQIFFLILLADFITGHVHWWEDAYGNPNWKFLGLGKYVVLPNLEHHKYPRKLCEASFFNRIKISLITGMFILFIIYLISHKHGYHHTSPYNINYCVMTNYLNPILNKIKYWEFLEWIISLFGIKVVRGSSIRKGL